MREMNYEWEETLRLSIEDGNLIARWGERSVRFGKAESLENLEGKLPPIFVRFLPYGESGNGSFNTDVLFTVRRYLFWSGLEDQDAIRQTVEYFWSVCTEFLEEKKNERQ